MGLRDWLADKISTGKIVSINGSDFDASEYYEEVAFRQLAFISAVNLIANAISKCEFKTFINGEETKGDEYYLWNYAPNKNQSSSTFLKELITKLYTKNEVLVIQNQNELLIADSFLIKEYALFDNQFTQVMVGDYSFNRNFLQSEVLYWKLNDKNIKIVIDSIFEPYKKMISASMLSYRKNRQTKAIFNYESLPQTAEAREAFDELMNVRFKKFLGDGDYVLPLGKGQSLETQGGKTYALGTTRDTKAMIDDISDFTAKAFGIPPALLRGDVQGTSDAVDLLLTFCIDPLADFLQEEIVRKKYGATKFQGNSYLKIDTKQIKHVDLLSVSSSIDKLISSGAFSVNEIRSLVDETPIKEDWADKHFITKNYMPVEEALKEMLKGGEKE